MHELAPLIYDLAIMLGLAGLVVLLFQRIHQPVVLGYLVAGVILGPHTPPYAFVKDISNIQILSELGVIFLMFSLGLEFSFQKLTRVGFSATITGTLEVVLMSIIGYSLGLAMGWSHYDCLFLGAALSISSTTIIIKAIDELGLKTKRFAELIFGVLIVEDLLAILLLVALSTMVLTKSVFTSDMAVAGVRLILVVGAWFLVGYFLVPPLFRRIAPYISEETLTIISVALCLFLVCVAAKFHYSTALGAFIMGSILAETVLVHKIEELIRPIRDIFAAVFFIAVGMLIDPMVIVENWPIVILISIVTIVGKILTTGVAAFLSGQSLPTSVRAGFGMAQVGEFSFIIAALGVTLNVTSNKLYPLIVAVSGITTFTTPYLIRLSGHIGNMLDQRLPPRIKYFLESYSTWVYRTQITSQQNSIWNKVTIRLIINGIVIAVLFKFVHDTVLPIAINMLGDSWIASMVCLFIVLALASPFIWGMLFSYKLIRMPDYAKMTFNPAVFMIWLVTLTEVAGLSIVHFRTWATVFLFFVIAILFFILSYRHLERSYRWFENQLVSNIQTGGAVNGSRYEQLAPWDTHLVEIEVGEQSVLNGKTLRHCEIRQQFGVNIVAIKQRHKIIPAPRGDDKIYAGDKLVVLGNDNQIDAFEKQLGKRAGHSDSPDFLDNFTLRAYLLEKHHLIVGKTIRHSQIREQVNGLVVGLERGNRRILNPDPDTVLQEDDLILIVGEVKKLNQFEMI